MAEDAPQVLQEQQQEQQQQPQQEVAPVLFKRLQPPGRARPRPPTRPRPLPVVSGLKKTLLVGINYVQNPQNQLHGCINDVLNVRSKLLSVYPKCTQHRVLTDTDPDPSGKPTRQNILDGVTWLLDGLKEGDAIYMHYSGHGGRVRDLNGDEASGLDNCIFPINGSRLEVLTDDELRAVLVNRVPAGVKAFVVFDCCYSGSGLDLRYNYLAPKFGTAVLTQNPKYPKSSGSVVYLSGCRDDQVAMDSVNLQGQPSGALTNALLDVWNTYGVNIKFKYLLWDIRQTLLKRGFQQQPQLSASRDIPLSDVFNLG